MVEENGEWTVWSPARIRAELNDSHEQDNYARSLTSRHKGIASSALSEIKLSSVYII